MVYTLKALLVTVVLVGFFGCAESSNSADTDTLHSSDSSALKSIDSSAIINDTTPLPFDSSRTTVNH